MPLASGEHDFNGRNHAHCIHRWNHWYLPNMFCLQWNSTRAHSTSFNKRLIALTQSPCVFFGVFSVVNWAHVCAARYYSGICAAFWMLAYHYLWSGKFHMYFLSHLLSFWRFTFMSFVYAPPFRRKKRAGLLLLSARLHRCRADWAESSTTHTEYAEIIHNSVTINKVIVVEFSSKLPLKISEWWREREIEQQRQSGPAPYEHLLW